MRLSSKNPGTEAFDHGQKFIPLVVSIAVLAAVVVEGAPLATIPVVLVCGAIYAALLDRLFIPLHRAFAW